MLSKINVQTKLMNKNCTGCGLCTIICPTNAIQLSLNTKLSVVRMVDNDKCVECNKCGKSCPQIINSD